MRVAETLRGFAEAGLNLCPQARNVPVVVRADGLECVRKTVNLCQLQAIFRPSANDDSTAGGTQINRGAMQGFHLGCQLDP